MRVDRPRPREMRAIMKNNAKESNLFVGKFLRRKYHGE